MALNCNPYCNPPLRLCRLGLHDARGRVWWLCRRCHGSNDLLVSDVIRTGEMQAWFIAEHLVDTPLVRA